jgi:hypothetical protein
VRSTFRTFSNAPTAEIDRNTVVGMLIGDPGGPFDLESLIQRAGVRAMRKAKQRFVSELRRLVDAWINSAQEIDPAIDLECDTPSKRSILALWAELANVRLNQVLVLTTGGQANLSALPPPFPQGPPKQPLLDDYASDCARFWFLRLLNSPQPTRLARCKCRGECAVTNCRRYFVYEREIKGRLKHGSYCPECRPRCGGRRRVEDSRGKLQRARVKAAAIASLNWKPKRRTPDQAAYVAEWVNKYAPGNDDGITPVWVARNRKKILEKVEEIKDATRKN